MISTDYPLSEPSKWTGYSVGFGDGLPARCNIINAPPGCKSSLLEPNAKSGGVPSPENHPVSQQSDQLGIKLKSTRALVSVLVIDHVERPSEN